LVRATRARTQAAEQPVLEVVMATPVEPQSDVEAQDVKVESAEEKSVGVGVLGWLGFIIVNLAAWGIVGVTTAMFSWIFGLGVCIVYIAVLIGLAFWLERYGSVYKQFVNLLWVLAGWFVFIAGAYIAVNTLSDLGNSGGYGYPAVVAADYEFSRGLPPGVPSNASTSLKDWASNRERIDGVDYIHFGGNVFFNGRAGSFNQQLLRSDGSETQQVGSGGNFLTIFSSKLYYIWQNRIYTISESSGNFSSEEQAFTENYVEGDTVEGIFVENDVMYYAVYRSCADSCASFARLRTVFSTSDGSTSTDLRGNTCEAWWTSQNDTLCGSGSSAPFHPGPSRESTWGMIFLAAVPMLIMSFVVLIKKKMPGLFFNIFGGIVVVVVMVYTLIDSTSETDAFNFYKWFFVIYTSLQWIALVAWSLAVEKQAEWLEELKTWATSVVGVTFFIAIHFLLEIPSRQEAWLWVIYGLLAATQMFFSAVVKRTLPMVTGALGAFVVAWKVAHEVAYNVIEMSGQTQTLALFGIIGLEGVGIILAAIAFAKNRDAIQDGLRKILTCRRRKDP